MSAVALLGRPLLIFAVRLAVVLPVGALLVWGRVRGPLGVRVAQRLSLIASAQALTVVAMFLGVNDNFEFYTSWQDLLGSPPPPATITTASAAVPFVEPSGRRGLVQAARSERTDDGGQLLTLTVHGAASDITAPVLVHLPAGYDASKRRYPVVELLTAWRGTPAVWTRRFHIVDEMLAAERRGTLGPVILVIPTLNVALPRDVECTDVPHGPRALTWLTTDVHALVMSAYRALPARQSWGVMGLSTGAYCAVKMLLARPSLYASAVALAGYFEAIRDSTTGDLWGGSRAFRDLNSPYWLVTHRPVPRSDLLAFASRQDATSYPSLQRFLQVAHAPLQVSTLIAPRGGHNLTSIAVDLPEVLDWIGARLTPGRSSLPGAALALRPQ